MICPIASRDHLVGGQAKRRGRSAERQRARRILAERPGDRAAPAQRVIDDPADGVAIARACEPVSLVKPGGRLVYVTCSILPEENGGQIEGFLAKHSGFSVVPYAQVWGEALTSAAPTSADGRSDTLLLTPGSHGTDGFFIAVLKRAG